MPPIAGEIKDTSSDTVFVFLNMPRRLSALHGAFGCGDLHGEMALTIEPLLDELRDELAEFNTFELLFQIKELLALATKFSTLHCLLVNIITHANISKTYPMGLCPGDNGDKILSGFPMKTV